MNKSIYSKEYSHLIKQLRQARIESGLTQVEVSKILNKTQSCISKMEKGQLRIDIIQLKEFANLYKKPLEFFLK